MKKILMQSLSIVVDFIGGIFVYLFYIKGHGKRQSKQDKRNRRSSQL